jgi:hypothetical protein
MRGVRILLFFEKHLFWGLFNIIVIIQSLGIRCDGSKWQQMAAFWQRPGRSLASDGPLMAAGWQQMAANGSGMAAKWQQMAAGDGGGVWRGAGCANSAIDYNKQ